jgi:hypothetical protein
MTDFENACQTNRRAVADFVALARSVPLAAWNTQPVPGKWSPAQVTEHVALAYEQTRDLLKHPGKSRGAPRLLRPVIRFLYVRPILRNGRFPSGGKSPRQFQPTSTSRPAEELCGRLESAALGLEGDFDQLNRQGQQSLTHPIFGSISLPDALRFQAFHTTHHRQQLPR